MRIYQTWPLNSWEGPLLIHEIWSTNMLICVSEIHFMLSMRCLGSKKKGFKPYGQINREQERTPRQAKNFRNVRCSYLSSPCGFPINKLFRFTWQFFEGYQEVKLNTGIFWHGEFIALIRLDRKIFRIFFDWHQHFKAESYFASTKLKNNLCVVDMAAGHDPTVGIWYI